MPPLRRFCRNPKQDAPGVLLFMNRNMPAADTDECAADTILRAGHRPYSRSISACFTLFLNPPNKKRAGFRKKSDKSFSKQKDIHIFAL